MRHLETLHCQNPTQPSPSSFQSHHIHSKFWSSLCFKSFLLPFCCFSGSTCQPSTWRVTQVLLLMVCVCVCARVCLQRRGRDQELGDLHLHTLSHTLRSMWALGCSLSSYMCTLKVLYIYSSVCAGSAMASRCSSIFRERTLTGDLPNVHKGHCPSLMLSTFLAINRTHK